MNRTWIFNCNPNGFDLPKALSEGTLKPGDTEHWRARQQASHMSPGDRVYHWVTGPQAGLYAVSHIEGTVRQDAEVGGEVVDLRFDKVLLPPIPRASLEAIPELSGLAVLAMPRKTNYLLSPDQAMALDRRCGLPEQWPFEPSSLAEVLRLDPMQPELRSSKGQREMVKSRVQGFLDLLASRVWQEYPDPGRLRTREAGDVKGGRLTLARLVLPGQGGLPDLECALGILDSSGQPSQCLFAGIALGGAAKEDLEGRLTDLGLLQPEDTVRSSQMKAFLGRTVRVGCFLSADEVELKSPAELVDQLVGELVAWGRRLRQASESSTVLQAWARCARDLAYQEDRERRREMRRERIRFIAEKLEALLARKVSLRDFASWMDSESKNHSHWGFQFAAGQTFLNILATLEGHEPELLAAYLEALRLPEDEEQARERLQSLTERLQSLTERVEAAQSLWGKAGFTPNYLPYHLSFFWQIQDRQKWPVYWSQSLALLLERLGLFESVDDPADRYLAYLEAARALRNDLETTSEWGDRARLEPWWALEEFGLWMKERSVTPSLEPQDAKEEVDLVSRLEGWFEAHRLRFPRVLLTTYALALQAKPFVILSGLSGTGKTKLARLFAEFISPDRMVEQEPGERLAQAEAAKGSMEVRVEGAVIAPRRANGTSGRRREDWLVHDLARAVPGQDDGQRRLDRLVQSRVFPNRSRAIQAAVEEKLQRLERRRLAEQCAFLDPVEEAGLAEEGLMGVPWPEY